MLDHSVFAYRTDDDFATVMGSFLAEGVQRSEAILAVTTSANRELLREQLGTDAQRIEFVDVNSFYATPLTALETAKAFADDRLTDGASWVRFLGEPVWAEKTDAEIRLWTRYESIFNLVFAAAPMTVVCPYDERIVDPEIIRAAHRTHPHARDERGLATCPDYADPREFALS